MTSHYLKMPGNNIAEPRCRRTGNINLLPRYVRADIHASNQTPSIRAVKDERYAIAAPPRLAPRPIRALEYCGMIADHCQYQRIQVASSWRVVLAII